MRRHIACSILIVLLATGCVRTEPDAELSSAADEIGLDGTLRLADAAFAGGDVDGAMRLYEEAARKFAAVPKAKAALADALLAAGAYPEATAAYHKLAVIDSERPDAQLGLGRVALAEGRYDDARAIFQRARRQFPDDIALLNGLAVAHDYAGEHAEAQDLYQRILDQHPANRGVANNYALSLLLAGRTEDAMDRLTRLAAGPTLLPQARFNLALAYGLTGDEDAARTILQDDLGRNSTEETLAFFRTLAAQRNVLQ